jgi:acyl dehydratase
MGGASKAREGLIMAADLHEKQKVDRYRAILYAGASGDFNPLHIDPAVGEKAGFGGPILHGMCTAAWMVDAVTRHYGDPRKIKQMNSRFAGPVRLGDELNFVAKEITPGEAGQTYTMEVTNQDGEPILKRASVVMEG